MTRRAALLGPLAALFGAPPEAQAEAKGDFYADHLRFARAWNRWSRRLKHLSAASPDFAAQVRREASAVGLQGCWTRLKRHL